MSTASRPELPEGFRWAPRWQHAQADDGLFLGDEVVAMLLDRLDGGWIARLDCQRGMDGPLVTRPCSTFGGGRRGCELWAIRHETRLRAEVAAKIAARPMRLWVSGPKQTP